ncbi:MAG: pyridoxamine 5'-phosphate oxidase family protein [Bacteroidia bacterium]
MDSINKNQEEENHQDLNGETAAKKIKELVEKAETCFFCTRIIALKRSATRPMSVQKVDDSGVLWFLSASDSHKNKEIEDEPFVQLYFQGSAHSDFMELYGKATISTDKEKIKELWNPLLKTWFTEGEDDPRITVIRVDPYEGYYWDTKHGNAIAGMKIMIGALVGKTLDDSIEGKLHKEPTRSE